VKQALYAGLILGLVPFQVTALNYAGIVGVRPDLALIATFLIGFLSGGIEGLLMGVLLGCVQDLFSAGSLWVNLITKGLIGILAGLLGRHLANATPVTVCAFLFVLSVLSGSMTAVWIRAEDNLTVVPHIIQSVVLPQALFDATLGAVIYWLMPGRRRREAEFGDDMALFGR
jgi:LytS/YehU family sensor histidine kinase